MDMVMPRIDKEVNLALQKHGVDSLLGVYRKQGEFLALERFLPQHVVNSLAEEIQQIRYLVNRNFIPGHKKGGSISSYFIRRSAPSLLALYQDPHLIEWLSQIAGVPLVECPEDDPHGCALYFYTEAGDHIGFHYDTSYYKGARYTALLGIVDRSSSRLVCRLNTKNSLAKEEEISLSTDPGAFIFFNGDKLYHAVTPIGDNEERIVLTMQYVTNPEMGTFNRWYSNIKDAVGYFGWSALFRRVPKVKKPT